MIRILQGDCREVLRTLPDESVHCVVTSPPYFGLRDYGTATWEGGDPACEHSSVRAQQRGTLDGGAQASARDSLAGITDCRKCGAHRIDSQIGLEPTPDAYVAEMVAVFREVRRVLRKDGTCWLNLGDSYNAHPGQRKTTDKVGAKQETNEGSNSTGSRYVAGIKPKDLLGIPWSVALALRTDGWWLRQDIIWSKPNPMPESVTDRCTKAHEYLFLLTKSARYYYDAAAIVDKAAFAGKIVALGEKSLSKGQAAGANVRESGNALVDQVIVAETRNKRSVWTVATQPYSEAHFATFPPALIEPCILAGCPAKCCAKCGAPWVRLTERTASDGRKVTVPSSQRFAVGADGKPIMGDNAYTSDELERGSFNAKCGVVEKAAAGFSPSCSCDAGTLAGTVLDPFSGAGTTGLVADRLQRNAILIELNESYAAMAERRIFQDSPLLMEAAE